MRRVRGDVAREARDPRGSHPYDLLPLRPGSCEPSQQGEALHLRLAARPLWTYAVAELSARLPTCGGASSSTARTPASSAGRSSARTRRPSR